MAVIGTVTTIEASYASGARGHGRVTKALTGAGTTTVDLLAAASSKQHHAVNGVINCSAADVVTITSDAGSKVLAVVNFAAAGPIPFPSVYSEAGKSLAMQKTGGSTISVYVEIDSLLAGANDPAAQ